MTLSPSAALSILIPINIDQDNSLTPDSPTSLDSVDIQSDDENDRQLASKRLSRYYPETPISTGAIVRPQFSCPDFAMGTARGLIGRLKEAPPVPTIPTIHLDNDLVSQNQLPDTQTTPSPRRVRKQNSFLELDNVNKRRWDDTFGEETPVPRKRHGLFLGRRLQVHGLEPPNPHRRSRFLTSFDELFKPDLPSAQRYPFKEDNEEDDSIREKIKQGMEDSIIPSAQATPIKAERIPLKERIKNLMNAERPKRRRKGWLDRIIVGKRKQKLNKECTEPNKI